MMNLEAKNLGKVFQSGNKAIRALDDVSLSIAQGEFVVVSGRSGSGKTTLLNLLSGLDKPTSGQIFIGGRDITPLGEDDLAPLRNRTFGFVFQSFYLVPSLNALENVALPAELADERDAAARSEELLRRVGLWDRRHHFPEQLSGGEQQRIAICRALVNNPDIIFADEPTGNLDSTSGRTVVDLLLEMRRDHDATLLMVTHNEEIAEAASRVIHLSDGRIERETTRA